MAEYALVTSAVDGGFDVDGHPRTARDTTAMTASLVINDVQSLTAFLLLTCQQARTPEWTSWLLVCNGPSPGRRSADAKRMNHPVVTAEFRHVEIEIAIGGSVSADHAARIDLNNHG